MNFKYYVICIISCFNCFSAEQNINKISFKYLPNLYFSLSSQEINEWNFATNQNELKKAFLFIFSAFKNKYRKTLLKTNFIKLSILELQQLENQLIINNDELDLKIKEANEEILEIFNIINTGKLLCFDKWILDDYRQHVPPYSVLQEWNNSITTHELKHNLNTIMFSILCAKKMGFIRDIDFLKIVSELGEFNSSCEVQTELAQKLLQEIREIAINLNFNQTLLEFGKINIH